MSELSELEEGFEALKRKNAEYLPKVDPVLIQDLLRRERENPGIAPMYLVEVFTKPGLETQEVRQYILDKTGMCPAIYDNGTHYATNQKLTIEMLKEISDSDDVIEVTGEYAGSTGSWAASHEHRSRSYEVRSQVDHTSHEKARSAEPKNNQGRIQEETGKGKSDYKIAAFMAAGIIGAIALAGFLLSGGLAPNSNSSSSSSSTQVALSGTEPGLLYGYVAGPVGGLPAVATTIIATDVVTGQTTTTFVSIYGQYTLNLAPFTYNIIVAFPDGTSRVVASELQIERGATHELDISY